LNEILIPKGKKANILEVTISAYLKFSQRGSNKGSELSISLLVRVQSGLFLLLTLQKAFGT